jgi:2-dehydropantoate 2-reductase
MSRIALIGPGAIGGTVCAALVAAGHDVEVCAHQAFASLTLTKPNGEVFSRVPVSVVTEPTAARTADWVLACVKAHQTPTAEPWLRQTVRPGTKVAVLQNGVEHRDRIAPFLPPGAEIVPIVVQLPAQRTAPGEITTYGGAQLIVADGDAGRDFVALFSGTFVKVQATDDFMTRQWEKLCLNASSGSISTLTLNPDAIATVPGLKELAKQIIAECIAVGRAEGAKLSADYADTLVEGYMSRTGNRGNSMYYDRLAGRMLEYDARNAVVVRLGRKHGIPTPVSAALVPLLRALCPPSER